MSKISQYSSDTAPTVSDYLIGNQASGPTTKKFLLSDLLTLFLNNIPATEGSFGFVSSGLVWSGDAYASTRAASMTAGRVRVNTTFLAIGAVTARIFTASKDTYVDVLDNLDGTGTLVYTEVTNNAASPALAANSVRIAIIVTGASNIAAVGSVNQGQENIVLPIASSIAYSVTDSLGNLICPRDSTRRTLGYRQVVSSQSGIGGTVTQLTGLSVPVIIPTSRKIKLTLSVRDVISAGGAGYFKLNIWDGAVVSGTQVAEAAAFAAAGGSSSAPKPEINLTPSATSKTYNAGCAITSNTAAIECDPTYPAFLRVELA